MPNTATTEIKDENQLIIRQKFSEQENNLLKQEDTVRKLREFFAKYHDVIAPFRWRCYGWDPTVVFDNYDHNSKDIARAFGAEGWTRHHDSHSCGSVNWTKTIDGIELRIECAESIQPQLIKEVRL